MSVQYQGSYSSETFNAAKRYKLKFQKNVPLADIELSELNKVSDSFVRQLVSANFPTGSTINNGFKVVESTTPTNNFTIKGGVGTVNGAGVLFVDGYILFLKNDIEYNGQDATGSLTDDGYTETDIPALTTPSGNRTDEVYVDFYFAEVSGTSGSEYEDSSLLISGIGINTANRLRMVQDIRVAEGGTTPANGNDDLGIYHWYIKIATINRLGGNASITNAMIVDNRILVNSNYSYMNGTAGTIKLVDGADIGDSTHRISNIYMNSNIDYKNALTFSSSGEKIRFTTDGKIGIGTTNPTTNLHIEGSALISTDVTINGLTASRVVYTGTNKKLTSSTVTGAELAYLSGKNSVIDGSGTSGYITKFSGTNRVASSVILESSSNIGIGTTTPLAKFHVAGIGKFGQNSSNAVWLQSTATPDHGSQVYLTNDLGASQGAVRLRSAYSGFGTGGYPNFEISRSTSNQTYGSDPSTLTYATSLVINGNTGNVGIGTTNPSATLHVIGDALISSNLTVNGTTTTVNTEVTTTDMMVINQNDNQVAFSVNQTAANSATVMEITNAGSGYALLIGNGNVGIGTTAPGTKLHVEGTAKVTGNVTLSNLTASRAIITDASKNVVSSAVTSTELGYLSGVTSAVQTQLNYKISNYQINAISNSNVGYTYIHFATFTVNYNNLVPIEYRWHFQSSDILHMNKHAIVYLSIRYTNPSTYEMSLRVASTGSDIFNTMYVTSVDGITFKCWIKTDSTTGYNTFFKITEELKDNSVGTTTYVNIGTTDVNLTNIVATSLTSMTLIADPTTGNVGIGTINPTSKLQVQGAIQVSDVAITCKNLGITRKPYFPLGRPTVCDLTLTDIGLKGFRGGFTDGRYGYFVPNNNGVYFGKVARVDLNDFSTVSVLNLASTDVDLRGFYGGFTDGRYGYFVPNNNGEPFGKIARVDLNDFSTVSVLDLTLTDPALKGFNGGFTDGRYGYFVPYNNGEPFGKVARVDLNDFSTISVLNLANTDVDLKGFNGGFTDGRYGYFVPNANVVAHGKIARVDLNDFSTVSVLNLASTDVDLKGFNGGFTDGRYGYFVPFNNGAFFGKVARVDLNDFSTVSVLNLASTDVDLKGFIGGFTDGRYGYFVPHSNGAIFGKVARVDLNDFSTVSVLNLANTDVDLKAFVGGFTDGRYGYFVPYYGKVARIMVVPGCSPNGNI